MIELKLPTASNEKTKFVVKCYLTLSQMLRKDQKKSCIKLILVGQATEIPCCVFQCCKRASAIAKTF